VKPVGEPDAGDRHVRFDERGWETARCRMAQATAPILDSTDEQDPRLPWKFGGVVTTQATGAAGLAQGRHGPSDHPNLEVVVPEGDVLKQQFGAR
jgi:hypothetical protein